MSLIHDNADSVGLVDSLCRLEEGMGVGLLVGRQQDSFMYEILVLTDRCYFESGSSDALQNSGWCF